VPPAARPQAPVAAAALLVRRAVAVSLALPRVAARATAALAALTAMSA
jgi:hypothetical protein